MADSSQTSPPGEGTGAGKPYRRSWKNLLINKRYQLRFTLFMVGLSAVLMMLLGIWVKRVADNTTEVGLARVRGEPCPPVPEAVPAAVAPAAVAPVDSAPVDSAPVDQDPSVPTEVVDPAAGAATGAAAVDGSGAADVSDEDRPRNKVTLEETSMTITPTPAAAPVDLSALRTAFRECEKKQAGLIEDLQQRRRYIGWVMLGSGLLLCLGLALYGIKMTHRVAGPLHKVGTYFAKMRDGRYDAVYPLRKGDELMEFYNHFKAAHGGVVAAERADIEKMRAVVAAGSTDLGSPPVSSDPQLAKAMKDLQAALEKKEKALE
jgi:hypothetical protein